MPCRNTDGADLSWQQTSRLLPSKLVLQATLLTVMPTSEKRGCQPLFELPLKGFLWGGLDQLKRVRNGCQNILFKFPSGWKGESEPWPSCLMYSECVVLFNPCYNASMYSECAVQYSRDTWLLCCPIQHGVQGYIAGVCFVQYRLVQGYIPNVFWQPAMTSNSTRKGHTG